MSLIVFKCGKDIKEDVLNGFWKILHDHYMSAAFPCTYEEYEDEGDDIYSERMNKLMESELVKVKRTRDGLSIEFDTTEDAGFSITDSVYKTGGGYSDQGLTYVDPIIDEVIRIFPTVCFDAQIVTYDEWGGGRCTFLYDWSCVKI